MLSRAQAQPNQSLGKMLLGLSVYFALGLSLSGPILVSWRERLGRRRLVWGVGESLWFAIGILAQNIVFSNLVGDWIGTAWGLISSLALLFFLPALYLTGNPRIEVGRSPAS